MSFNLGKQSRSSRIVNTSEQAAVQITKSCPPSPWSINRIWSALNNEDVVEIQPVRSRLCLFKCDSVSASKLSREYVQSVPPVPISSKLGISSRPQSLYIPALTHVRQLTPDELRPAARKTNLNCDRRGLFRERFLTK